MLFHLGVVRCFKDAGLLDRVSHVFAVSGGSILAAHLALHWSDYAGTSEQFEGRAQQLIAFSQSNVRARVLRRLYRSPTEVLQDLYDELFEGQTLHQMAADGQRKFSLLTTDVNTGEPACFTARGLQLNIVSEQDRREIPCSNQRVALAVAASSAFPALFPPITLTKEILAVSEMQLPRTLQLTDGGVYDNLGVWALRAAPGRQSMPSILSDASLGFDWTSVKQPLRVIRLLRTVNRSFDIASRRVYEFERAFLKQEDIVPILIGDTVTEEPCLTPEVQRQLQFVRTDFDRFRDDEIRALCQHGYETARDRLSKTDAFAANANPLVRQPLWEPLDARYVTSGTTSSATTARQTTTDFRLRPALDPNRLYRSRQRSLISREFTIVVLLLALTITASVLWWARPVTPQSLSMRVGVARSAPDPLDRYPDLVAYVTLLNNEIPKSQVGRILVLETDPAVHATAGMQIPIDLWGGTTRVLAFATRMDGDHRMYEELSVDATTNPPVVYTPPMRRGDRLVVIALQIAVGTTFPGVHPSVTLVPNRSAKIGG